MEFFDPRSCDDQWSGIGYEPCDWHDDNYGNMGFGQRVDSVDGLDRAPNVDCGQPVERENRQGHITEVHSNRDVQ